MARHLLLCLILLFSMDAILLQLVTGADNVPNPQAPASSPSTSSSIKVRNQEAAQIRKHRKQAIIKSSSSSSSSAAPAAAGFMSPVLDAPQTQMTTKQNPEASLSTLGHHHHEQSASNIQLEETPKTTTTMPPKQQYHAHHNHHSVDKSVAGGGVIIGGLGTAFFVAIVCYIRATRRRKNTEPAGPDDVADVAKV